MNEAAIYPSAAIRDIQVIRCMYVSMFPCSLWRQLILRQPNFGPESKCQGTRIDLSFMSARLKNILPYLRIFRGAVRHPFMYAAYLSYQL